MKDFRTIDKNVLTAYQLVHKCDPMTAYRELFSQRLLDMLEPKLFDGVAEPPSRDDVITVLREIVNQVVGTGARKK